MSSRDEIRAIAEAIRACSMCRECCGRAGDIVRLLSAAEPEGGLAVAISEARHLADAIRSRHVPEDRDYQDANRLDAILASPPPAQPEGERDGER